MNKKIEELKVLSAQIQTDHKANNEILENKVMEVMDIEEFGSMASLVSEKMVRWIKVARNIAGERLVEEKMKKDLSKMEDADPSEDYKNK